MAQETVKPAEAEPEPPAMRPIRYASAEINPLSMLVGLFGGQIEVGVAGPVALVASPSYLSFGNGFYCTEVDGCGGGPAAHGLELEVGPRVFLPIEKPQPNRGRTFAWIQPSWGHDWIQIEATSESAGHESIYVAPESVRRNRFVLDLGVHVPIGRLPLYASGGLGYSQALDDPGKRLQNRSTTLANSIGDGLNPGTYVRGGTSIRILFAVGAGF